VIKKGSPRAAFFIERRRARPLLAPYPFIFDMPFALPMKVAVTEFLLTGL
jgi:hypothetical protein